MENQNNNVIGLGEWLMAIIITVIPILNIIMLFYWSFSKSTNPTKANWAKANLVVYAIIIILTIIAGIATPAAM